MEHGSNEPSRKRRRLSTEEDDKNSSETGRRRSTRSSLLRPISPPPLRRNALSQSKQDQTFKAMSSPFQLTRIRDLPESSNVDTISLKDILGDPLIAECWEFNYLHDLDFLMDAFDEDVRGMVKVHVVHGFWKNDDQSRLDLKEQAAKYSNITLHTAFMPEMFGTHHSKMLVLIRQDSTAQVIIHTANMIPFDWTNMTQGLWKSPLLPLLSNATLSSQPSVIGSGTRFKIDFINYLRAYDDRRVICKPLIEQLTKYNFSEVRAALIASVPGKQGIDDDDVETKWGWAGLKDVLKSVPARGNEPEIDIQISSIATLGQTNKWLDQTLFRALRLHKGGAAPKSKFRIIFPTADEVRRSLNGYDSGSAIHTKIQTAAQVKQLQYLKPLLCHWAGDGAQHSASSSIPISDAGRKRAAPHIKTYIRFADKERSCIDWMLVTSANLSKQAWGETTNSAGEVRICSYEIGVMVWPGLFGENATMVPTFKSDTPPTGTGEGVVIGARMPYDLPVVPYAKGDKPWCATSSYTEPDWKGETYNLKNNG